MKEQEKAHVRTGEEPIQMDEVVHAHEEQTPEVIPAHHEPSLFPLRDINATVIERVGRALVPLFIALLALGLIAMNEPSIPSVVETSQFPPGSVLATLDTDFEGRDYDVPFRDGVEETTIWVWDFAAEDGDWVQLLFNGQPLGPAFMILNAPQQFRVPVGGSLEVLGIRDGGGGITYAVNFPEKDLSFRNAVRPQTGNTYRLHRDGEP